MDVLKANQKGIIQSKFLHCILHCFTQGFPRLEPVLEVKIKFEPYA